MCLLHSSASDIRQTDKNMSVTILALHEPPGLPENSCNSGCAAWCPRTAHASRSTRQRNGYARAEGVAVVVLKRRWAVRRALGRAARSRTRRSWGATPTTTASPRRASPSRRARRSPRWAPRRARDPACLSVPDQECLLLASWLGRMGCHTCLGQQHSQLAWDLCKDRRMPGSCLFSPCCLHVLSPSCRCWRLHARVLGAASFSPH